MRWMIKRLLEIQCRHGGLHTRTHTHTPGERSHLALSHTHTHTLCCRMICLLTFPLLWFLFQALNQRGRGLVGGGGPILVEELLSGGGGQPKGRILVLESARGEEGWNHVSFILPLLTSSSPSSSSPYWESINSFNPVFLWIRLAFWATAVLQPQPSGEGRGPETPWKE